MSGAVPQDLAGQVAFVTDAAHGQGRASAMALAREGVRIAALDVARPLAYPATRWARPASSKP
jgi:NAD(P)-dependent dehydrogenase (short-subunit alcohol dehydrogenase family)